APEYRRSLNSLIFRLEDEIHEEVDAVNEIVRWRYDLLLDNRTKDAVRLTQVVFALSLDETYSADEAVAAEWTLAPGEIRRVVHAPVFRVADFREGRNPLIAR